MAIPSLFRQMKPKEFKYTPRYYDPEKEAREERVKRIKAEMGIAEDGTRKEPASGGSLTFDSPFRRSQQRAKRNSGIRLVVILLVLFMLIYLFWIL